ncbi:MAG: UDP-N-acetylmuramoyl-L-alanine--D-glutamate ligase [Candidatus Aminicenantes bacterium]|nr:MAG: UDP-N-acetylmuramoyl-L-alanine--D-glutamate ligase [Candidatus Aminicenantes bacterium]
MELQGTKALVVGLGRTGEAVCDFLIHQGAEVKISEKTPPENLGSRISFWQEKGVEVEAGCHKLQSFLAADLIIPSPGVPYIPELDEAKKRGHEILSEIELAYRFIKGKIVGITGTNGKSTTATLTHRILKDAGLQSHLAGNIGTPLIQFVEKSQPDDLFVTELSSFQLRYITKFRASISLFLNISADHLDWHTDFDDYYQSKKNLLLMQKEEDTAILNRDYPQVWALRRLGKFKVYAFSQTGKVSRGSWIQDNWIILIDEIQEKLMQTTETSLFGIHNRENIMASALVGHVLGIPASSMKKSIIDFKGLEHRLEKAGELDQVIFYNDSKATNIDASLKSIQSFSGPIVLILGGRDKGGDFVQLRTPVRKKVKAVVLIGEAADKIQKSLNSTVPMTKASDMKEAVHLAYSAASPKGVVLLAPGCTSFDMFQNYEERGTVFKGEVKALIQKVEQGKD